MSKANQNSFDLEGTALLCTGNVSLERMTPKLPREIEISQLQIVKETCWNKYSQAAKLVGYSSAIGNEVSSTLLTGVTSQAFLPSNTTSN